MNPSDIQHFPPLYPTSFISLTQVFIVMVRFCWKSGSLFFIVFKSYDIQISSLMLLHLIFPSKQNTKTFLEKKCWKSYAKKSICVLHEQKRFWKNMGSENIYCNNIHRFSCLSITTAIKSSPQVSLEFMPCTPLLDIIKKNIVAKFAQRLKEWPCLSR